MKTIRGFMALCLVAIASCTDQPPAVSVAPPSAGRDLLPGFTVRDITGPHKGTSTCCYCCLYGMRPVVAIFTRGIGGDVQDLVKTIDSKVDREQERRLAGYVIFIPQEEKEQYDGKIKALAKDAGIANLPLTIISPPPPPPEFKVPQDAEVTVVMWVKKETRFRRSFDKGELDSRALESLVAEIDKVLD